VYLMNMIILKPFETIEKYCRYLYVKMCPVSYRGEKSVGFSALGDHTHSLYISLKLTDAFSGYRA